MRFIAVSDRHIVFTDDYSDSEIKSGIHLRNIEDDFKKFYKFDSCFKIHRIDVIDARGDFSTVLYV